MQRVSKDSVVFNLDATAGRRMGYHYFNEYGNIFLENRYTDWGNYYPHWTLRNLWMLSKYIPARNLQIEFLNNFRNQNKYTDIDLLAPGKIPFEYTFALTMMAQPLAWMEATGLHASGFDIAPVVKKYRTVQQDIHNGNIVPIGEEPTGFAWTGFQSIQMNLGYFLILRENNPNAVMKMKTYLPAGTKVKVIPVLGKGKAFKAVTDAFGAMTFSLPQINSYVLYKYSII
ncbi:MAG: hypothetical protein EOP53_28180 [Sphingobacteriales bacterium]|nr:MAG: hypothetical protein EOP53_28180 [Sphingobacteriales bacterium]